MNTITNLDFWGCYIAILILILVYSFGYKIGVKALQNEAIDKGYAEYTNKEEWKWLEEDVIVTRNKRKGK